MTRHGGLRDAAPTQDRDLSEDLAAAALTLARRFAAGATMWCVAPTVAVPRPPRGRRVRPPGDRRQAGAARRERRRGRGRRRPCGCWPVPATSSWSSSTADDRRPSTCCAGPRPGASRGSGSERAAPDRRSRADHVVWSGGARPRPGGPLGRPRAALPPAVGADPRRVRAPGSARGRTPACTDEVCITCSDEGRVAEVRAVHADGSVRGAWWAGGPRRVDVSLVDPVAAGDLLLVHAGVALTAAGGDPAVSARSDAAPSRPASSTLHRGRGARRRRAPGRPGRSAADQDRREQATAGGHPRAVRRPSWRRPARPWPSRFRHGGRLFAFGNGGSATDAEGTVAAVPPPAAAGSALPALSLVDDRAVLTALANDVGFELVFSRQIIAHARPGDIAVGFSTSGDSVNVLRAFEEAVTAGPADDRAVRVRGRAPWPRSDAVRHCLVVRSDSVHRIQEAQDALMLGCGRSSSGICSTERCTT